MVFNVNEAPPVLEMSLSVDSARLGSQLGTVIVTGTVTCNTDGYADVSGSISQRQGLNLARTGFSVSVNECSTTPLQWTATTEPAARIFLAKSATVTASASGCDAFTCGGAEPVTKTRKIGKK